jgi:hypothetical protein
LRHASFFAGEKPVRDGLHKISKMGIPAIQVFGGTL